MAAEAYSEIGGSPLEEGRDEFSDTELDDRGTQSGKFSDLYSSALFVLCCLLNLVFTFWSMLSPSVPSPDRSPPRTQQSQESQEEFDSLFDSVAEDHVPSQKESCPPPLSDNDLAVFDPCYKQGEINVKQHMRNIITALSAVESLS